MHHINIPEAKIDMYLPSELGECDARQYMEMCGLIFGYMTGTLSFEQLKLHAVYKLCNIKKTEFPLSEADELLKYGNLLLIAELVEDFFIFQDDQLIVKQSYTHNPVPSFKPLFKEYFGPTDSFMNVKHGEYVDALRLMHDFHATRDIELLYLLAAILYRPAKKDLALAKTAENWDGDIRERYNSKLIDERASEFKKIMPIGFIYGVYMLFTSFQIYLSSASIMWAGKEIDLSLIFEPQGDETDASETPGIGMDSVTFAIAETGAFGTVEQMRETNNWEILIRMYDIRKRDMDSQQQFEKNDQHSKT